MSSSSKDTFGRNAQFSPLNTIAVGSSVPGGCLHKRRHRRRRSSPPLLSLPNKPPPSSALRAQSPLPTGDETLASPPLPPLPAPSTGETGAQLAARPRPREPGADHNRGEEPSVGSGGRDHDKPRAEERAAGGAEEEPRRERRAGSPRAEKRTASPSGGRRMAKDLLWELALMAWPLLKEEAAELAKSVLRELAREEAKTRLKAAVKAGAEGLKGLLEAPPSTATPAPAAEVADPRRVELLVDGAAVCIDHAPLLLRGGRLLHLPLFVDDVVLARVAPSLLGRLGPEMGPAVEALLRGKLIAPGVQSALRSGLELPPAVRQMLAAKFETSAVQSLECSSLIAFAASPASSITEATAGAGAQALPSLQDFVVCASALGVIALALYLIWRGPRGGGD
ncbi:adenomatous polyposis coli protein 2 [Triticum aestivum]|uniref:adenomatous polyposis coli protein 2 n=1 Tax=Triticum aestivum TaxID=4565 RepID=UPI001D01C140|nr:adenomatous polyposis coli protein 2-like [Triticum aestivum]